MRRLWERVPTAGPVAGSIAAGLYGQAALVVTGVLSTRALGPTDRGYFALLLLLPAVLQQLGTFGLPLATTYFIASDRSQEGAVRRAIRAPAIAQVLVLTVIQATVLWFILDGKPARVQTAALLVLPLLAGELADMYGKAIVQGQGRYTAFNLLRTVSVTFYLIGVVALFASGHASIVNMAIALVASNLLSGSLTLAVALRHTPAESANRRDVSRAKMIRFGLRGFLGSVSPVETFRLDQAFIGLFLAPRALGLYIAGLAFTNLPSFLSRGIGMIALPQLARDARRDADPDIWRFFAFSTALTGVVIAALELAAGWLVPLFFGQDFKDAVSIARILLVSSYFYGARRVLTDSVSGSGRPGLGSLAELTSWVVLLPLLGVFVPVWGIHGVATAMAIAAAASLLVLIALTLRWTRGDAVGIALPSGIDPGVDAGSNARDRRATVVVVQTIVPEYRSAFFQVLAGRLRQPLLVLSGDDDFTTSHIAAPTVQAVSVRNRFFAGRRLLWQSGSLRPAIRADVTVMILNPRILTVWVAVIARRIGGKRTVLWGHAWPRTGRKARSDKIRNVMRRLADTLIVYSEVEARELRNHSNGVDVVAAPNALYRTQEMRPALSTTPASSFVFVGRLVPEKKPGLLLEGFRMALSHLPDDVRLVFLGDGELRSDLEEAAARAELADRVDFRGHVSDVDQLREVYAGAIASVSPGSVGLTLIQSIGFGIPVIAARDEPHGPELEAGIEGETLLTFESDSPVALASVLVRVAEGRSEWLARRSDIAATIRASHSIDLMVGSFIGALRLDDTAVLAVLA